MIFNTGQQFALYVLVGCKMSGTMRSIACLLILPVLFEMKLAQANCEVPQRIRHVLRTVVPEQSRGPFEQHSIIEHRCKPGYEHKQGDSEIICMNGKWMVIENDITRKLLTFQCKRKRCPLFEILNGKMKIENSEDVTFRCDGGFQLDGFPSTKCLLNAGGEYFLTSPLPSCERIKRCNDPGIPRLGKRIGDCCEVWSELTYECDNGYELVHRDDGNSIKCLPNEQWSGPPLQCKPVGETVCPNIPFEENNLILRSNLSLDRDVFLVDDEVNFDCKTGYDTEYEEMSLLCLYNGSWDRPIPICKPKPPCSLPPLPSNGRIVQLVENSTQDKFPILYEMVMECDEGYTSQNGHYGSICLGNNVWSYRLNCTTHKEFTDKEGAAHTLSETMKNKTGTDLFFAFDSSGRISDLEFERAKDFVITIIRQVGISHGYGGVRVAVFVFGKQAVEVVHINAKNVGQVTRALQNMKRKKEGSDITSALNKLMALAALSRRSSPNRKRIAFILTNGFWSRGGDPTHAGDMLRNPDVYNVVVYAIGIGKRRNLETLFKITGDKNRVLLFATYENLVKTAIKAIDRDEDYTACGLERSAFPHDRRTSSTKGNRRVTAPRRVKRIVGGKEVEKPWPWMAALAKRTHRGYATQCGGSIIHHEWILTAAHSFKTHESHVPKASEWQVTVGATDLTTASGWDIPVAHITLHDKYDVDNLDYDIALVKLRNPISYSLYIRPICLPPALNDIPANTELYNTENTATVIGYGHTGVVQLGEGGSTVDHLRQLEVRLQPDKVCQQTVEHGNLRRQPTPQMICSGSGNWNEDVCYGDGGGPLMQLTNSVSGIDTQERWYVVGVNSWGIGCGLENYYSYYSYVAKLRQWIDQATQVEFENAAPLPKRLIRD